MIDRNEPAFPRNYNADGHNGMTLRDYFAGQALQGIATWAPMARGVSADGLDSDTARKARARWSYAQADAMLAARKEPTNV